MTKTQKDIVVDKLNEEGAVDNFWALSHFILRLGAIIHSLKADGWEFDGHFGEGHERKNYIYKATKKPELRLFN